MWAILFRKHSENVTTKIPQYLQLDKIAENLNYSENLLALQRCSGGKMLLCHHHCHTADWKQAVNIFSEDSGY